MEEKEKDKDANKYEEILGEKKKIIKEALEAYRKEEKEAIKKI